MSLPENSLQTLRAVQRDSKGKKMYGSETIVRGDDGSPIVRAEPVLTRDVFDRVGVELTQREVRREPTTRSTTLLLQVIYCGVCGRQAYRLKGGPGRKPRYRCASAQYKDRCTNRSILLEEADVYVTEHLLDLLGDSERLERERDSGSDHSAELADIDATLTVLADLIGTGVFRAGTPQREEVNRRIEAYAKRRDELAAEQVKPAGWRWKGTGETFGDWWPRQGRPRRTCGFAPTASAWSSITTTGSIAGR